MDTLSLKRQSYEYVQHGKCAGQPSNIASKREGRGGTKAGMLVGTRTRAVSPSKTAVSLFHVATSLAHDQAPTAWMQSALQSQT